MYGIVDSEEGERARGWWWQIIWEKTKIDVVFGFD